MASHNESGVESASIESQSDFDEACREETSYALLVSGSPKPDYHIGLGCLFLSAWQHISRTALIFNSCYACKMTAIMQQFQLCVGGSSHVE